MVTIVIELEKEMIEMLKSQPAIATALVQEMLSSIPEEQPQPKAVTIEELYGMINDKRHELLTLHASYGNSKSYCEQQALQDRINVASKELNRLMAIAQC